MHPPENLGSISRRSQIFEKRSGQGIVHYPYQRPTRGVKRPHDSENEKQSRKLNPLHGIVEWINQGMELPQPDVPIIVVLAASFDVGDCNIVWRDIVVPVGSDLLNAFVLLLQTFVVCNVKCRPSDKLFYSFFYAYCFKIGSLSTTGNKFLSQLN
ncbi:uncharacterized protein LOC129732849 [Wyeomyia smithii]|uniref:uncharacterized protein LOC129732849 n=1 Tax=Wyeomyia smithii TaxID=174621 RepID=UPI00246801E2|nr:uncharacterized protein LOC129732849 [Wyeomyia smithii]